MPPVAFETLQSVVGKFTKVFSFVRISRGWLDYLFVCAKSHVHQETICDPCGIHRKTEMQPTLMPMFTCALNWMQPDVKSVLSGNTKLGSGPHMNPGYIMSRCEGIEFGVFLGDCLRIKKVVTSCLRHRINYRPTRAIHSHFTDHPYQFQQGSPIISRSNGFAHPHSGIKEVKTSQLRQTRIFSCHVLWTVPSQIVPLMNQHRLPA